MEQSNKNFGSHYLLPDASVSSIGIFSTLHYEYKKHLIQGGVRYDYRNIVTKTRDEGGSTSFYQGFDKNLGSFTGSIGIKTGFSKHTNLRLNLASGFRAPNLSEFASNGIHSGRIEIGNSNLKNEKNRQVDLSLEYGHTHIELFANVFLNNISDYIYLKPNGMNEGPYAIYEYQQDDAQLYGGEIAIHLHPHPWDWLHIDSSFESVYGQLNGGSNLPLIPANQLKNQLSVNKNTTHKLFKKYYINLVLNHTFKTVNTSLFEINRKAYTLVNASFGSDLLIKKLKLNIQISAHNIFDVNYISHLSVLRDNAIPNMGQNIIIGFTTDF
jgi:iron complex outermembrane receptor protein